jgi:hypothetical protein
MITLNIDSNHLMPLSIYPQHVQCGMYTNSCTVMKCVIETEASASFQYTFDGNVLKATYRMPALTDEQ